MRHLLKMGALCLSALILSSCHKHVAHHWIEFYLHVDYIKGRVSDYLAEDGTNYYHISLYYGFYSYSDCYDRDRTEYDYYVNLHQDFANDYIMEEGFLENGFPGVYAPSNDLQSMTIRLTQDWDESHLADNSLDDIAWFVGLNSTDFIHKGSDVVNSHSGWSMFAEEAYGKKGRVPPQYMRLIDCPLSECMPEDFFLLGEYDYKSIFDIPFCHIFIKHPETAFDSLPFEIRATDIEGNEFIVKL